MTTSTRPNVHSAETIQAFSALLRDDLARDGRSLKEISRMVGYSVRVIRPWIKGRSVPASPKTMAAFRMLLTVINADPAPYGRLPLCGHLAHCSPAAARSLRAGNRFGTHLRERKARAKPLKYGNALKADQWPRLVHAQWNDYLCYRTGKWVGSICPASPHLKHPEKQVTGSCALMNLQRLHRIFHASLLNTQGFTLPGLDLELISDARLVIICCLQSLRDSEGSFTPTALDLVAHARQLLRTWLPAQPDGGQHPHLRPQLEAGADPNRAWRDFCAVNATELWDWRKVMIRHNSKVRCGGKEGLFDEIAPLLARGDSVRIWQELNAGLLDRAQAPGLRKEQREAALRDLVMIPLLENPAFRPENICGAKIGTDVSRLDNGDLVFATPGTNMKNRGTKSATGGVRLIFSAQPVDGKWDYYHHFDHYLTNVRQNALDRTGLKSDYVFLPSWKRGSAAKPFRLNTAVFGQRVALIAVQILGPRAVGLCARNMRHLLAAIMEQLGRRGDVPVVLRHSPETSSKHYLRFAEPCRLAKAVHGMAAHLKSLRPAAS